MKQLLGLCLTLLLSTAAWGQLELPQKSPKASNSFVIGLTKVTIEYSSPAVKGRNIWGGLVTYNEVWRAGANEATTVEFSTDVMIEDTFLKKGKYSLFFIPQESGTWVAIFNKVANQWGAYSYNEAQDALRVEIKAKDSGETEERLNFKIVDTAQDRGYIRFAWEKKRAYILIRTDMMSHVMANVQKASETAEEGDKWLIHAQAADWYLDNGHPAKAKQQIEVSTGLARHSRNCWIEAKVKAYYKDYKGAVESAKQAQELGKKADSRFYNAAKNRIERAIAEWSAK